MWVGFTREGHGQRSSIVGRHRGSLAPMSHIALGRNGYADQLLKEKVEVVGGTYTVGLGTFRSGCVSSVGALLGCGAHAGVCQPSTWER